MVQLMPDIDAMESAITTALNGPVSVLKRMRLACTALDKDGRTLDCATLGALLDAILAVMLTISGRRRMAGHE